MRCLSSCLSGYSAQITEEKTSVELFCYSINDRHPSSWSVTTVLSLIKLVCNIGVQRKITKLGGIPRQLIWLEIAAYGG